MAVLPGWGRRKEIQYGTIFPDSNLTDFPILVSITADTDIAGELAGGGGITVTAADGTTELPIGLYPTSNLVVGDVLLRFRTGVSTAASPGDIIGYLYYDANQATAEDKVNVVSNSYGAFYVPGDYGSENICEDWVTGNHIGGDGGLSASELVAGVVGLAWDMNGVSHAITAPTVATPTGATVSAWVKYASTATSYMFVNKQTTNTEFNLFLSGADGSINARGGSPSSAHFNAPAVDSWHRFVGLVGTGGAGDTPISLAIDGVMVDADGGGSPSTNGSGVIDIGRFGDFGGGFYLDGQISEVSISLVVRSIDWINYAYNNDVANSDTVTLGAEEILEEDTGTGTFLTAQGYGVGSLILGGDGAGYTIQSGSGVGQITLGGSGQGDAPAVAPTQGSGIATITLGGVGIGYTIRSGHGIGSLTLDGSGSGEGEEVEIPTLEVSLNFDTTQTASLNFPTLVASLEAN